MRTWRLLVEIGPTVWTYVVAAPDHEAAWALVLEWLPLHDRERASLEELEATGEGHLDSQPRVVHAWRTAPLDEGVSAAA